MTALSMLPRHCNEVESRKSKVQLLCTCAFRDSTSLQCLGNMDNAVIDRAKKLKSLRKLHISTAIPATIRMDTIEAARRFGSQGALAEAIAQCAIGPSTIALGARVRMIFAIQASCDAISTLLSFLRQALPTTLPQLPLAAETARCAGAQSRHGERINCHILKLRIRCRSILDGRLV